MMAAGKVFLAFLLICAVLSAQTASFAIDHHSHSSQHCCRLCHAGPLSLVQPAASSAVAPSLSVVWLESASGLDSLHTVSLAAGGSRAPPV
jgi:hypothetical protein